jgi:hypothetical protein
MKVIFAVLLVVGLAGCGQVGFSNCGTYKDEAACIADTACHWNKNEGVCKS